MATDKNAAEAIVQHLIDEGVKHVFGITGDTVLPILDAMYGREDEIRYITCRLEHAATGMADGYSRVTGEPACLLLHVGPGISNAVLGTLIFVIVEVMLFAGLISAFCIVRTSALGSWPPPDQPRLPLDGVLSEQAELVEHAVPVVLSSANQIEL